MVNCRVCLLPSKCDCVCDLCRATKIQDWKSRYFPKWITFRDLVLFNGRWIKAVCVEGPNGMEQAEKLGEIIRAEALPYPADPRINSGEYACPSFCLAPTVCQGKTSCPRSYACSE